MSALPARARDLLWSNTTLVLATERDGRPWIASVFYAPAETAGGLTLTCALLATSGKLANLRRNPHAAVYVGPREPTRWLQASAVASILDREDAARAAIQRLLAHAPAAAVFVEKVPVVPVMLRVTGLKLTDLTGALPPVETWEASTA
jgi:hypothetical protein